MSNTEYYAIETALKERIAAMDAAMLRRLLTVFVDESGTDVVRHLAMRLAPATK